MKIPALAGAGADVSAEKGLGDTIYEAIVSIIEGITNFINQLGSSAFGSVYSSIAPYVMILAMSWVVLKAVGVFTKQDNFRGLFMGGSKIGIVALSFFILQSNNPAKILTWLQDGYESAIGVFGGTPSDKGGIAGIFETLWKTTVGLYDFMSSSYSKMVEHTLANLDGSWYEILGTHISIAISKICIFLIILICQIFAILTVLTLTFLVFLNHVTFTALLVIFPFVLLLWPYLWAKGSSNAILNAYIDVVVSYFLYGFAIFIYTQFSTLVSKVFDKVIQEHTKYDVNGKIDYDLLTVGLMLVGLAFVSAVIFFVAGKGLFNLMKTTSKLLSQNDFSAGSKNALQEIGRDSKGVLQATGKGLGKGFGWGINKTKSGISWAGQKVGLIQSPSNGTQSGSISGASAMFNSKKLNK